MNPIWLNDRISKRKKKAGIAWVVVVVYERKNERKIKQPSLRDSRKKKAKLFKPSESEARKDFN